MIKFNAGAYGQAASPQPAVRFNPAAYGAKPPAKRPKAPAPAAPAVQFNADAYAPSVTDGNFLERAKREFGEGVQNLRDVFHTGPVHNANDAFGALQHVLGNVAVGTERVALPFAMAVEEPLARKAAGALAQNPQMRQATSALDKVGQYTAVPGELVGAAQQDLTDPSNGWLGAKHTRDLVHKIIAGRMGEAGRYYFTSEDNLRALAARGDALAQYLVGNAPQGQIGHPWAAAGITAAGEAVDPLNAAPEKAAQFVRWLAGLDRVANFTAKARRAAQAAHAAAQAHPVAGPIVKHAEDIAQRAAHAVNAAVGNPYRYAPGRGGFGLDRGVAPGHAPEAHAASRILEGAGGEGHHYAQQHVLGAFGPDTAEADIVPALQAHQARAHRAFVYQQKLANPALVDRAKALIAQYWRARHKNVLPLPADSYESVIGRPTIADLGQGHHFLEAQLSDLSPEDALQVQRIARSLEFGRELPAHVTPAQAALAQRYGAWIAKMTRESDPRLLPEGFQQVGYVPKEGIYEFDPLGNQPGVRAAGVALSPRNLEATYPTLYRAMAAAKAGKIPTPYSELGPVQSLYNAVARRYANMAKQEALEKFADIPSQHAGHALISAPTLRDAAGNVVDAKGLGQIAEDQRTAAAIEETGRRLGLTKNEAQALDAARMPSPGVAAGRAREARQAANAVAKSTTRAAQVAGRAADRAQVLEPKLAAGMQQTEHNLRTQSIDTENRANVAQRKLGEVMQKAIDKTTAAAKRAIDRFVPTYKAGRKLDEALAEHPRSKAAATAAESRAALAANRAEVDRLAEQLREKGGVTPQERNAAIKALAESLAEDVRTAQQPYWDALEELGGKIIPDQRWDAKLGRFVDTGEFEELPLHLRGSAKRLREETQASQRHGNLDELTDLIRERTHNPDLTDSDVREFFFYTRKPKPADFKHEAMEQFRALTAQEARAAQDEYLAATRAQRELQGVHRENLDALAAAPPLDANIARAARQNIARQGSYAKSLARQGVQSIKRANTLRGQVEKGVGATRDVYRKGAEKSAQIVEDAHTRFARQIVAHNKNVRADLEQLNRDLDRLGAKASDNAKLRELHKQFARMSAQSLTQFRALFNKVLEETALPHFPQELDNTFEDLASADFNGRGLNMLDSEGLKIEKNLAEHLRYMGAPDAVADEAAHALSFMNWLARTSFVTNFAIHTVFNQGLFFAFRTGLWDEWARTSAAVMGLALKPGADLAKMQAISDAATRFYNAEVARTGPYYKMVHELGVVRPHAVNARGPFESRVLEQRDSAGKLIGYTRTKGYEPAQILATRYRDLTGKVAKASRTFMRWNQDLVFGRGEPLIAAKMLKHLVEHEGKDVAAAADEVRDLLGTDKITRWLKNSWLMFPRWAKTALVWSIKLGLTKPATWNVPLQATRIERQGVGAGDLPTGLNPMALAIPDGGGGYWFLGLHLPNATAVNMAAALLVGDPRYAGAGAHYIDAAEYGLGRFNPQLGTVFSAGLDIPATLMHRKVPFELFDPNASVPSVAAETALGVGGRFFAPIQSFQEAISNPFDLPAGVTGTTVYHRNATYDYPEEGP